MNSAVPSSDRGQMQEKQTLEIGIDFPGAGSFQVVIYREYIGIIYTKYLVSQTRCWFSRLKIDPHIVTQQPKHYTPVINAHLATM